MALEPQDQKDDAATKTVASEPVVETPVTTETVVQQTAPAVVVEPTEPAAAPVVQKTEAELADEKRLRDEFEQKRLDDEAAVREQAGKPAKKELRLVEVENLRPTAFMQASTGKWIQGHSTETLLDDGWLENQVKAKLLKRL